MKLQRAIYFTLTLGIVAQVVFNVPLAHAQGPSVPVRVTNTPLPVQGAVSANITNSSVPVSGSVNVSNTQNAPLFAEIESAARAAVGASCDVDFTDPPSQVSCPLGTVPSGKILVIETVTCRADTSIGGSIGPFTLSVGTPGMGGGAPLPFYYDLALTKTTTIPGAYDMYVLTSQIRVYAAPGTGVAAIGIGEKPINARTGMVCTIAGHLVTQ
jgi:hypothetical protein